LTDITSKVVDLSDFIETSDADPGDETDSEVLEFPADAEGGTIEVTLEEILASFAQGMEILRLGILELNARLEAVEEKIFPADASLSDLMSEAMAEAELSDPEA
jgi:exonuclease VII small subunit